MKKRTKEFRVSASLGRLSLWYDYTIVCDNLRSKVVEKKYDEEFETEVCKWGVELTNPVEYTRKELLDKYDENTRIYRWVHTFTENGEPAMAVVIEG